MNEYDITAAFKRIEDELIASMIRNMDRHRSEEDKEGFQWTQWQAEQLKALEKYKRENRKKYNKEFRNINQQIDALIRQSRDTGSMEQEIAILKAIKNGFKATKKGSRLTGQFFRLNERKLETLIQATTNDMKKAEIAVLRMANDQYRKAIFNAQVYANSGAGTYEKAVDMATKDMLSAGLNCVEYKNGARHTISDYADMAIRTANKRAYLQGEGNKRQEWGISTVIMNKRGNPCPKCLPWIGKVLIDDVWSGGTKDDGKYPMMSYAISKGLYHPRCKDSHTTYFPGISTAEDTWTREELKKVGLLNREEVRQQYAARQAEKYDRLAKYSLAPENKRHYRVRADKWEGESSKLTMEEEGAIIRYVSPDSITLNDKLRRKAELTEFEKEWIIKLNNALDKLPEYKGDLNRSLYFFDDEIAQEYFDSLGDEVSYPQYISATKTGVYNPDAQVQIYIQDSKKGKDLGKLNDMESEVLYPINTRFRVVNKEKEGGKYYILLEEVD